MEGRVQDSGTNGLVAILRAVAAWHASSDDAEERADIRALYRDLIAGKTLRWLGEHDLPHLDFAEAMRNFTQAAAGIETIVQPFAAFAQAFEPVQEKVAKAMQPLEKVAAAIEAQMEPLKEIAGAVCTSTPEEVLEIDTGMRQWERLPLGERRRWARWTPLTFSRFGPSRTPRVQSRPHGRRVGRTQRVRRTRRATRAGPSPSGSSEPPLAGAAQ